MKDSLFLCGIVIALLSTVTSAMRQTIKPLSRDIATALVATSAESPR